MSGPLSTADTPAGGGQDAPTVGRMEILEGRTAEVGGLAVRRLLPRRQRRTVGAWCFVDHMGPDSVAAGTGLIGPHPHIGLQTVTWLLEGEALHRDSLGSEQVIRPGQLNLMTAGHGVAHAEESPDPSAQRLHGVQLWVAQPSTTRDGAPAFEHHAELPQAALDHGVATVLLGELGGARSPARRDTEHVGVDLMLRPGRTVVPLDPGFEHALVALGGQVRVGDGSLELGHLGYLGVARGEVPIEAVADARVLLIGGAPFPEPLVMWWNYVARTREEITAAHRDWSAGAERFGTVASSLARVDVAGPPWAESG